MNIQCKWDNDGKLLIQSYSHSIGYVYGDIEPTLYIGSADDSLTFTEIEYIIDCFYNMPKK